MGDDIIPEGSATGGDRSRRRLGAGIVLVLAVGGAAVLLWWLVADDSDDGSVAASASSTTTSVELASDATAPVPTASPEGPNASTTTSEPTGSTSSTSTPGSVGTSAPAAATTVPNLDVDPQEAVDALVGQGLTATEAQCVVDAAVAEYGSAAVVADPNTPTDVKERLFEITQDCLFG